VAPANVNGKLLSLPTTAAPYEPATNRVSTIGSRALPLLASRMPASEASTDPRIQLYRAIEIGGAPFNAARVGLSTTARMATPVRLTNRRLRSTSATTTASTMAATLSRVRRASQ